MEQKREPEQKGFGGLGRSTFSDGLEAHYEIPLEADHNTKSLHTRKCADALDEPASTWDSRKRPKFSPAFTAPCKVLHASGEESLANMLIPVPMMYAYCVKKLRNADAKTSPVVVPNAEAKRPHLLEDVQIVSLPILVGPARG